MKLSTSNTSKSCWIFLDKDTPDSRGQSAAVARSYGYKPHFFIVRGLKKSWLNWLPYSWFPPKPHRYKISPALESTLSVPPLIITCGKHSEKLAISLKGHHELQLIAVGKPQFPKAFEHIILWPYEAATAPNEISLNSVFHSINTDALAHGKKTHYRALDKFSHPCIAVLIGGHCERLSYDEELAQSIAKTIRALHQQHQGSFFIYTGLAPDHPFVGHIKKFLFNIPFSINDSIYDNPYLGYLAMADGILAYDDSISLICEAAATGKPLYIAETQTQSNEALRFLEKLCTEGFARPFKNTFDLDWSPKTLPAAHISKS